MAKPKKRKLLAGLIRLQRAWKLWRPVIIIIGLVGFSIFIFQEAVQLSTFACWAYERAEWWKGYGECLGTYRWVMEIGRWTNRLVGWLNPIGFPAYIAFFEGAAPRNLAGMEANMAAHTLEATPIGKRPEALAGTLSPEVIEADPGVFVGQQHEVGMKILRVSIRERVTFLEQNRGGFYLVIFNRGAFEEEIGDLAGLEGSWVIAVGEISLYRGRPQIILEEPDQLEIITQGYPSSLIQEYLAHQERELDWEVWFVLKSTGN
jgi:hypothetical protein